MITYAKVVSINEDIEEEVLLSFGDINLVCFINSCPFEIVEGGIYLVDVSLSFLDDFSIQPSEKGVFSLKRIGDGFSYLIKGIIYDDKILTDHIIFQDEIYQQEYSYLNGGFIEVLADRIGVSFL